MPETFNPSDPVTYDDGTIGTVIDVTPGVLTVRLPDGTLAHLHPDDAAKLNARNAEPVCVMSCERCEPEVSAACDSEGSHAEAEQPGDDRITAHVVGKLTGGSRFTDGAVLLNVNRTSLTAYVHEDRPLSCQRTDKGYGKRGEFTVSAPANTARSLRVDGKGPSTLHLTTEEARDLLNTLTTILALDGQPPKLEDSGYGPSCPTCEWRACPQHCAEVCTTHGHMPEKNGSTS